MFQAKKGSMKSPYPQRPPSAVLNLGACILTPWTAAVFGCVESTSPLFSSAPLDNSSIWPPSAVSTRRRRSVPPSHQGRDVNAVAFIPDWPVSNIRHIRRYSPK
ncbi:hypothetical protein TNCV_4958171 [Trichonephila clavipes]|nr:hypothetical protein TNCV_4958171 [Trichonephila clavipes]